MNKTLLPDLEPTIAKLNKMRDSISIEDLADSLLNAHVKVHIAVLTGNYVQKILSGSKTIESRFSKNQTTPFRKVSPGDIILLKKSGGPIYGLTVVQNVKYFGPLQADSARKVMQQYQEGLDLDEEFIEQKAKSKFASLFFLFNSIALNPFRITKGDMRPWVVLNTSRHENLKVQIPLPLDRRGIGKHDFYRSKLVNSKGYPKCKHCGADFVDWERLHRRDISDTDFLVSQLVEEKIRYQMWNADFDDKAIERLLKMNKGTFLKSVEKRIWTSVGKVYRFSAGIQPFREGYQTPFSGNVIYYAQYAMAACCRRCIEYWHGIPRGRELTSSEVHYLVQLILFYVERRVGMSG